MVHYDHGPLGVQRIRAEFVIRWERTRLATTSKCSQIAWHLFFCCKLAVSGSRLFGLLGSFGFTRVQLQSCSKIQHVNLQTEGERSNFRVCIGFWRGLIKRGKHWMFNNIMSYFDPLSIETWCHCPSLIQHSISLLNEITIWASLLPDGLNLSVDLFDVVGQLASLKVWNLGFQLGHLLKFLPVVNKNGAAI